MSVPQDLEAWYEGGAEVGAQINHFRSVAKDAKDAKMGRFLQGQQDLMRFQNEISQITKRCYDHCVKDPRAAMTRGESKCISLCSQRMVDSAVLLNEIALEAFKNWDQ